MINYIKKPKPKKNDPLKIEGVAISDEGSNVSVSLDDSE